MSTDVQENVVPSSTIVNGSKEEESALFSGRVIQITNVSPGATLQQMATLFGFLGTVTDIRLYPTDEKLEVAVKLCYIQYESTETCGVAQHLTNTVFIDKALIVVPLNRTEIPEVNECVSLLKSINSYAGMTTIGFMGDILPTENEIPPLPPPPVIPSTVDPKVLEDIRRTIFVESIAESVTCEQVMAFFSGVGELKYLRLCKSGKKKHAFIEFNALESVATAMQYNGVLFGGCAIKVHYAKSAIVKPDMESFSSGKSFRKSRDSIRRRSRTPRISRDRSRSPRRKRSPSRSRSPIRRRRRSRSKSRSRENRRRSRKSLSRSKSPKRSPKRRSRSRSPRRRSRSRSPKRRSRSRSLRRNRSPKRRSRSKSPKRKSRKRSRTISKSPPIRKRSKKSTSKSPEPSKSKKKRKDKEKGKGKSTEATLQSLLTKIHDYEEEKEKEKERDLEEKKTKLIKEKKKKSSS